MKSQTLEQVKRAIREPYAWPGGYPVYTVMSDGALLCPTCARENFRLIINAERSNERFGWRAIGVSVYWEGPDRHCVHCGKPLQSAYGDPDANETEE